jgi:hypothetical protein
VLHSIASPVNPLFACGQANVLNAYPCRGVRALCMDSVTSKFACTHPQIGVRRLVPCHSEAIQAEGICCAYLLSCGIIPVPATSIRNCSRCFTAQHPWAADPVLLLSPGAMAPGQVQQQAWCFTTELPAGNAFYSPAAFSNPLALLQLYRLC